MTKFDRHIKSCLMNNRTHEDVLSTGDIGTTIEAIQGLFTSECRNIQGPNNGGGSEGQKNNDGEKKNNPGAEDQSYTDAERVAFEVYPSCTFEQLQPWALIAERNVRRWTQIHTIPEADTEAELRKIIEGSEIGKLRGTPSEPIAIIYDPKLTGESIHHPAPNPPPTVQGRELPGMCARSPFFQGEPDGDPPRRCVCILRWWQNRLKFVISPVRFLFKSNETWNVATARPSCNPIRPGRIQPTQPTMRQGTRLA